MMLNFIGKTNKEYCMVNKLILRLKDGREVGIDRDTTYFEIDDGNLDMDWDDCYIWDHIDFKEDGKYYLSDKDKDLFIGAEVIELELEDDADEDYKVEIESVSIAGNIIVCNRAKKISEMTSSELFSKMNDSQRDDIYRMVLSDYTREDVVAFMEEHFGELQEEVVHRVVNEYVYNGNYDCNLSYWDNIKNLIEEAI